MRATAQRYVGFALCLWVLVVVSARARAQTSQYWPEVDVVAQHNRWSVLAPTLTRLQLGARNPQFVATGAVATYAFTPHWSMSAGYLYANLPQANAVAHVPLVSVTGSVTRRKWFFADTNRVERLMAFSNQPVRYRNRALADFGFGADRHVHVYGSDEYFFNCTAGAWNQNRALAGFGLRFAQHLRADAYVMQRSAPHGTETTVIGTVLTVFLGRQSTEHRKSATETDM